MYIETSSPRQQGDKAVLNSPQLQFSGSMCLKFYYHMYGSDIGTLNVIINGNNVFAQVGIKATCGRERLLMSVYREIMR